MTKHKRYQVTGKQLEPVIRYINENYPAGVGDHNIDQLSGADSEVYGHVTDVTLRPNGSLEITITTDKGHSVEKSVDFAEDVIIQAFQKSLPKVGYDVNKFPEWEVIGARMAGRQVVFDVIGDGTTHKLPIHSDTILSWLPELTNDNVEGMDEPDPDEYHDRGY